MADGSGKQQPDLFMKMKLALYNDGKLPVDEMYYILRNDRYLHKIHIIRIMVESIQTEEKYKTLKRILDQKSVKLKGLVHSTYHSRSNEWILQNLTNYEAVAWHHWTRANSSFDQLTKGKLFTRIENICRTNNFKPGQKPSAANVRDYVTRCESQASELLQTLTKIVDDNHTTSPQEHAKRVNSTVDTIETISISLRIRFV